MAEPKLIFLRPRVPTEVLELGVKALALKRYPARLAVIHQELARRAGERELRRAA